MSMETTSPSGIPITADEECLKVTCYSKNICFFFLNFISRTLLNVMEKDVLFPLPSDVEKNKHI